MWSLEPGRERTAGESCHHAIDDITGQHARDRACERGVEDGPADRPCREDGGTSRLQDREQSKILPEAQHGQVQFGAALQYRDEGGAECDPGRRRAGYRNSRPDKQAQHGADRERIEDHRALRRLVGARVEAAAGKAQPFESDDAAELADRDEERIVGEILGRQKMRDQQQEPERQQGLVGIGSESDDLTHRYAVPLSLRSARERATSRRYRPNRKT